jgi:hypothetical protein
LPFARLLAQEAGLSAEVEAKVALIGLAARIVRICDAFDAMTGIRSGCKRRPIAKALDILRDNLGTQFDRDLGERCLALGEREPGLRFAAFLRYICTYIA